MPALPSPEEDEDEGSPRPLLLSGAGGRVGSDAWFRLGRLFEAGVLPDEADCRRPSRRLGAGVRPRANDCGRHARPSRVGAPGRTETLPGDHRVGEGRRSRLGSPMQPLAAGGRDRVGPGRREPDGGRGRHRPDEGGEEGRGGPYRRRRGHVFSVPAIVPSGAGVLTRKDGSERAGDRG